MSENDTPLEFVGSSKDDLSAFPLDVKKEVGLALRIAQKGGQAGNAFPLKGFDGAGVLEIKSDFDGDTFRAVYTVKLKGVIYVLHAFQKKSKTGKKTSLSDIRTIKARLKIAIKLHEDNDDAKTEKRQE